MKRPIAMFTGTGHAVPRRALTNDEFAAMGIETSDEWIRERTGIRQRYIAGDGETLTSLVTDAARQAMADAADRALDGAKLSGTDVDLMIPHQANIRIIEATAKHANIPMEKVFVNVDRYGNTSAASIPIALDEARRMGRIVDGSTVLFAAFGAGFTWGSMVVRF